MSSWLIFSTLGLFPVSGQDIYLISTPSIPGASLSLGHGKKLHIVAKNLDSDGLNRYVQSATWNGVDLPTSLFRHAQIRDGATLVLTMGSAPSTLGQGNAAAFDERHKFRRLLRCKIVYLKFRVKRFPSHLHHQE